MSAGGVVGDHQLPQVGIALADEDTAALTVGVDIVVVLDQAVFHQTRRADGECDPGAEAVGSVSHDFTARDGGCAAMDADAATIGVGLSYCVVVDHATTDRRRAVGAYEHTGAAGGQVIDNGAVDDLGTAVFLDGQTAAMLGRIQVHGDPAQGWAAVVDADNAAVGTGGHTHIIDLDGGLHVADQDARSKDIGKSIRYLQILHAAIVHEFDEDTPAETLGVDDGQLRSGPPQGDAGFHDHAGGRGFGTLGGMRAIVVGAGGHQDGITNGAGLDRGMDLIIITGHIQYAGGGQAGKKQTDTQGEGDDGAIHGSKVLSISHREGNRGRTAGSQLRRVGCGTLRLRL